MLIFFLWDIQLTKSYIICLKMIQKVVGYTVLEKISLHVKMFHVKKKLTKINICSTGLWCGVNCLVSEVSRQMTLASSFKVINSNGYFLDFEAIFDSLMYICKCEIDTWGGRAKMYVLRFAEMSSASNDLFVESYMYGRFYNKKCANRERLKFPALIIHKFTHPDMLHE